METNKIAHALKTHWPLALGGVIGVYILLHYAGGGGGGGSDNSAALAAIASNNAMAAAQNQSYNLAQGQLAAQSTAAAHVAQVAQTSAIGDVIAKVGTSIGSVIAAQSALPAAAINAASLGHQAALTSAAGVAAEGLAVLPGTFTALAQSQMVSHDSMLGYAGALVDMTSAFGDLGFAAFNGVSTTAGSSVNAAAGAAAAGASANAAATGAKMGAVSHVADAAAKIFGGMMMGG